MIGNDIVDLKRAAIESNWQHPRFLDKIFVDEEQHLILNSEDSFKTLWRLWSMKESAYKVYVQKHQKTFFSPKKLVCQFVSNTLGNVIINGEVYYTKSNSTDNYIYTSTTLKEEESTNEHCFSIENSTILNQRVITYNELKSLISKKYRILTSDLIIKKNSLGIPKLYKGNKELPVFFSLTHHGNYGGISII